MHGESDSIGECSVPSRHHRVDHQEQSSAFRPVVEGRKGKPTRCCLLLVEDQAEAPVVKVVLAIVCL